MPPHIVHIKMSLFFKYLPPIFHHMKDLILFVWSCKCSSYVVQYCILQLHLVLSKIHHHQEEEGDQSRDLIETLSEQKRSSSSGCLPTEESSIRSLNLEFSSVLVFIYEMFQIWGCTGHAFAVPFLPYKSKGLVEVGQLSTNLSCWRMLVQND